MYTKEIENSITKAMEMHGFCEGTITAMLPARQNEKTKKTYYPFNAVIVGNDEKEHKIAGQVYENFLPYIGGLDVIKAGYKGMFRTKLSDLTKGINAYWGISGSNVDDASDVLDMFKDV